MQRLAQLSCDIKREMLESLERYGGLAVPGPSRWEGRSCRRVHHRTWDTEEEPVSRSSSASPAPSACRWRSCWS